MNCCRSIDRQVGSLSLFFFSWPCGDEVFLRGDREFDGFIAGFSGLCARVCKCSALFGVLFEKYFSLVYMQVS